LVWFGLVWFGLVWFGLVWFGLVWFGLVDIVCYPPNCLLYNCYVPILTICNRGKTKIHWEAISAIGEVIGALGVIASLFHVAYQVRQNTHQSRLNTKAVETSNNEAINTESNNLRMALANNSELATIYIRGNEDPLSLNENEQFRYRLSVGAGVSNAQPVYESHVRGVSTQWSGMRNVSIRLLDSPGGRWFWDDFKDDYNIEFQNEIDAALAQLEN
jgi:hypothetical protein